MTFSPKVNLHFDAPPEAFPSRHSTDAPLLGNGSFNMAMGGAPESLSFSLGRNDFWRLENRFERCVPLPVGQFKIESPSLKGADYHVDQELDCAITRGRFLLRDGSGLAVRTFLAATADLCVLELSALKSSLNVRLSLCMSSALVVANFENSGRPLREAYKANPPQAYQSEHEITLSDGVVVGVRKFDKHVGMKTGAALAWKVLQQDIEKSEYHRSTDEDDRRERGFALRIRKDQTITVIIGSSSLFVSDDYSAALEEWVSGVTEEDITTLESQHRAWWLNYWNRSFVRLSNPTLEKGYYRSLYTLACASRDPAFPPGLFGWNTHDFPMWTGDYHMNYNHMAPYYGLYSSNRLEQARPHYAPILDFMDTGKRYAREITDTRGVLYPVGIGPKGFSTGYKPQLQWFVEHGLEHEDVFLMQRSNAAYGLINMITDWYYTRDADWAATIYDYALAVVEFWEDYLVWEGDEAAGRYVILNDAIHEGSGHDKNPILGLALVRTAVEFIIDVSTALRRNADRIPHWEHLLEHLSDFPTQKRHGNTVYRYTEDGMPWYDSNTLGIQHIYPAGQIHLDSSESLKEIGRNTIDELDRWLDYNGTNSLFVAAIRVGYSKGKVLQMLTQFVDNCHENGVLLVLDARDWFDYFVRDLSPEDVPPGTTMLSFMVKGNTPSRQAFLEVTERDGSVWFRKIDVSKDWKKIVCMASDFKYIKGGEKRAGTAFAMANIASIGLGQDYNNAGLHNGKYWLWLDELAMSNSLKPSDFPRGDLGGEFRILSLYPYTDYDVFDVNRVRRVRRFEKSPFMAEFDTATAYSGVSTAGMPAPEDGFFIPLLSAYGAYDDALGWAGGAVINTAGTLKDSNWAFFNMRDSAAYANPSFSKLLSEIISSFKDGSVRTMKPAFDLSAIKSRKPKAIGFVKRSADGKTLVDENGDDFFLIGSNYIHPMNGRSFAFWKQERFSEGDLLRIEDDFRKMQAAGVNTIRIFSQDPMIDLPEMNAAIKGFCHKYGIQILMQIVTHAYDEHDHQAVARSQHVVSGFRGDSSVFAYDVQNEPQIGEIGGVRTKGEPSTLLKLRPSEAYSGQIDQTFVGKLVEAHRKGKGGYPKVAPWIEDKTEVADLYGADNLWKRAIDKVYSPKHSSLMHNYPASLQEVDETLHPFIDALDATYKDWYTPQAEVIRSMAPNQLVTVGYNKGFVALPFNKDLDMISQHSYFRAKTAEEVMLYTKIQDKLREIWPNKPVTIGEFGYSSGELYGGEYISNDSAAVAEMLMYLYSYAKGYSGVMKWRLNDDEIPSTFKDDHWLKKHNEEERIRQARFGMYCYDGYQSIPKPIVHCLSFFRDYVDSYATDRGTIEVKHNKAVANINTSYTYRSKRALFIGDVRRDSGSIQFNTPDGQVANVMAMWNPTGFRVMSTKTMEVTIHASKVASVVDASGSNITGKHGPVNVDGSQLTIVLIKGESVTFEL